jgi:hypothetical protein
VSSEVVFPLEIIKVDSLIFYPPLMLNYLEEMSLVNYFLTSKVKNKVRKQVFLQFIISMDYKLKVIRFINKFKKS